MSFLPIPAWLIFIGGHACILEKLLLIDATLYKYDLFSILS